MLGNEMCGSLDDTCLAVTLQTGSNDGSEEGIMHHEPMQFYDNLMQWQMQPITIYGPAFGMVQVGIFCSGTAT